jgi:hypothetical protein
MHMCKAKMARNYAPLSGICFSNHVNIGTIIGCSRRG